MFGGRSLGAPFELSLGGLTVGSQAEAEPDQLLRLLRREHNRVAQAVRENHPLWDDERVFQTARRVVIAQWQHITFTEYLPHLLGAGVAAGIRGPVRRSLADPTVSVEFAGAAFRFWQKSADSPRHQVAVTGRRSNRSFLDLVRETAPQRQTFGGTAENATQELDATNVLRGRDLGLPSYAAVLGLCTGRSVADWGDLQGVMDQPQLEELRGVYSSPHDVDLWVGGMLEKHAPSAKVGPTFQCVIADQFRRLRDGDRLFYERSLSDDQLREVRKASLARLICDNEEGHHLVAPLSLEPLGGQNHMALCSSDAIPKPDLGVF